jgi:hypothetical protein
MLGWLRESSARDRLDRRTIWLTAAAAACAALAILGWTIAPWRFALPGVSISSDAPFKPFSLALLALAVWIGASSRMRRAYARRSPLAFYGIATALLFLCALGPKPTLFGHQILYKPVYAWLMELPVFGAIRAPARFAMPAMLALSVAGALAFSRLASVRAWRPAFTLMLMCGVVADSWVSNLPMAPLPDRWPASRADGFAAVLEHSARRRLRRHRRHVSDDRSSSSGLERRQRIRTHALLHVEDGARRARPGRARRSSTRRAGARCRRSPERSVGSVATVPRVCTSNHGARHGRALAIFLRRSTAPGSRVQRRTGADRLGGRRQGADIAPRAHRP